MIDYHIVSKYCATCEHWVGERTIVAERKRVSTPHHATIGTCQCPDGHWRGRLKPGESNCPRWERLAAVEPNPPEGH